MVNETDKKSVSFAGTGSNPVDVFCFNFYFPVEEKTLTLVIWIGYTWWL